MLTKTVGDVKTLSYDPETTITRVDETWERWDYGHGETIWQRQCPRCDGDGTVGSGPPGEHYLQFCGACDGRGLSATHADPFLAEGEHEGEPTREASG